MHHFNNYRHQSNHQRIQFGFKHKPHSLNCRVGNVFFLRQTTFKNDQINSKMVDAENVVKQIIIILFN